MAVEEPQPGGVQGTKAEDRLVINTVAIRAHEISMMHALLAALQNNFLVLLLDTSSCGSISIDRHTLIKPSSSAALMPMNVTIANPYAYRGQRT